MSIEVRHLTKRFGSTVVCDDLSLDIPSGELVALLGPSGSGKTTLLRMIAGLERPDAGSVLFHGVDATDADVRSRRVGFVFQHYALFGQMTVFENVAFGLRVRPKAVRPVEPAIRAKVAELLALVQLGPFAERYPHQLSGGQRQRIALARALLRNPRILLLDEATSALDAESEAAVQHALTRLRAGRTTIVVAHRLSTVRDADLVVAMADGAVVEQGTHAELLEAGGLYARLVRTQALAT